MLSCAQSANSTSQSSAPLPLSPFSLLTPHHGRSLCVHLPTSKPLPGRLLCNTKNHSVILYFKKNPLGPTFCRAKLSLNCLAWIQGSSQSGPNPRLFPSPRFSVLSYTESLLLEQIITFKCQYSAVLGQCCNVHSLWSSWFCSTHSQDTAQISSMKLPQAPPPCFRVLYNSF